MKIFYKSLIANKSRKLDKVFSSALCLFGLWALFPARGVGQESQWQSLAGEASAMTRRSSPEKMDYNLEVGPVLLNVGASLTGGYNSNTGLSQSASGGSAYTTPAVNLGLMWPITDLNTLNFSVGMGYAYYFEVSQDNSPGGFFVAPNSACKGPFTSGIFGSLPMTNFLCKMIPPPRES